MKIIFLGTNGWFDSQTGNTLSTLIETRDAYIVFDAGYGFARLKKYAVQNKPIYLFISHLHVDHICGLHTLPMFNFKKGLTIFISKKSAKKLQTFMNHPFMSPPKERNYPIKIVGLSEGNYKQPFPFVCKTLKHIDNTFGYRINIENKIITHCCDTAVCKNDLELARDADLLIHECAFLPGEESYWGHTNPESAASLLSRQE